MISVVGAYPDSVIHHRRLVLAFAALAVLLAACVYTVSTILTPLIVLARNTPQLQWADHLLPSGPAIDRIVQATEGDPQQTGALYVPRGNARYPGVLLVNGVEVPEGWQDPAIETLSRSIAQLGEIVYVPDFTGLKQTRLSTYILHALDTDIAWFRQSTYVRERRITLVGICVGGSLALVAALEPANAAAVHAVVALNPYADLRDLIRAATTNLAPGIDGKPAPFDMAAWVRADIVRGLAAATTPDQPSKDALLKALDSAPAEDPLAMFRTSALPQMSPEGRAWWRLLANQDPSKFESLYSSLPAGVIHELDELSPLPSVAQLDIPALLAAPKDDFAFPAGEAWELQHANPGKIRLIRSSALDHVTPSFGPSLVGGYWQLLRFAYEGNKLLHQ